MRPAAGVWEKVYGVHVWEISNSNVPMAQPWPFLRTPPESSLNPLWATGPMVGPREMPSVALVPSSFLALGGVTMWGAQQDNRFRGSEVYGI